MNARDTDDYRSNEGQQYDGKHWKSLSSIARAITGAHWNGPRFFGLTGDGKS